MEGGFRDFVLKAESLNVAPEASVGPHQMGGYARPRFSPSQDVNASLNRPESSDVGSLWSATQVDGSCHSLYCPWRCPSDEFKCLVRIQ